MKKRMAADMVMGLCLLVMLGCGGYLAYYHHSSLENEITELKNMTVSDDIKKQDGQPEMAVSDGKMIQKKFKKIYQTNHDFAGWLTIEGTDIDYPVMHTPDDSEGGEYYIHRDFEGKYSAAGLPFIDSKCRMEKPTDNLIIYGHNMKSGKMFHDILKYADKDFYEEHKTIRFDTLYGNGTYEVVAMFYGQISEDAQGTFKYYEFVNAGSKEEFMDYIKNIKSMSIIDTGVNVEYGDKLITLTTCAYHVKNGRFAVVAKRTERR